jgi:hypothetical protein
MFWDGIVELDQTTFGIFEASSTESPLQNVVGPFAEIIGAVGSGLTTIFKVSEGKPQLSIVTL